MTGSMLLLLTLAGLVLGEEHARLEKPKNGKESLTATTETEFVPIPLPTDFESYDLDGSGYVEIQELSNVSDTSIEQCSKPFEVADVNSKFIRFYGLVPGGGD